MLCSCGHESSAYSVRLTRLGPHTCCRACAFPRICSVANPYDNFELEHVHDDNGRPLRVTSLRQMHEAERRHRFKSLVANERSADFDKPPQTRVPDLFEQTSARGGWLYPELAEQQIREMRETGEIGGEINAKG